VYDLVPMDDWQLLNEYATRNSEEAFRTLVERYAGMVYHLALRQVSNPHAAQEIAQAVFIALAQKAARIPRQTVLHGWLFRATRFAVLNLLRDEACRRRYEQEAMTMNTTLESNDVDSVWEQISPHLNDSLDRLSKTDREVVMVRFFGKKSHKEVARMLGVSEDAAKKRLSRALEKLRAIFARRGVVVPGVALVAAFSAYGAQAAPAGMASSITAVAVAKGVSATASSLAIAKELLRLMTWAKAKTAILLGTGLLLAAAGTTTAVVKTASALMENPIGKLERQSGKRIVWDQHLTLPATLDLRGLPLEQALDQLAVKAGAYWTIDYAVYESDAALRDLVALLQQGTELQAGGWTNLSAMPLQASISVVPYDPHGRSRTFLRLPKDHPRDRVDMIVVLDPEASAKLFQERAEDGSRHPSGAVSQSIYKAMREDVADGVLAPERLLARIQLASRLNASTPLPATAETAARLAKEAHAHWTTIYTLRRAPIEHVGIKLVHTGMGAMYAPTNSPAHALPLADPTQGNRFNLTPDDRAAHQRAVEAFKQKRSASAGSQ
jgi:RNA polymerase sigma factor (sigma-70 family)